jgi:branched-subunit amino acid transport protein
MEARVTDAWWMVAIVGVATIAIKAAGPVLLGGRPLPPRIGRIIGLLAPALLAALVATSTFGLGGELVLDERALGVGAGAIAMAFKAPPLVVVIVAAVVTATARAVI